jgi:ABC-type multidrug transport system permease subunit
MKLIKGLFAAAVLVSLLLLISCQALGGMTKTRAGTLWLS